MEDREEAQLTEDTEKTTLKRVILGVRSREHLRSIMFPSLTYGYTLPILLL